MAGMRGFARMAVMRPFALLGREIRRMIWVLMALVVASPQIGDQPLSVVPLWK